LLCQLLMAVMVVLLVLLLLAAWEDCLWQQSVHLHRSSSSGQARQAALPLTAA
jgi:hypothetical protein